MSTDPVPTRDPRPWQLAPGVLVVPENDGGLLLTTPTDEVARVALPGGDGALLRAVLAGELPPAEALRRADDAELLDGVLHSCLAEGIAGPAPVSPPAGPPLEKVAVTGDNPLARAVAAVLVTAGYAVAATATDDGPDGPAPDADVLVACAGWLPDRRWQHLDAARRAAGRPWHRCHVEGTRLVVGPYTIPPDGPTYADTRTRRLAASAWPDELETLWRHLDEAPALPAVPWPDPGVLSVAAGLIVADLCAHRAGRRPSGADHQVVIDPGRPGWRAHPVLPVPAGLMREPAR